MRFDLDGDEELAPESSEFRAILRVFYPGVAGRHMQSKKHKSN